MFYPEIEKLLLAFFPDATDALVYNHDVFDKDYAGDRTEDQDSNNPGVNANYANLEGQNPGVALHFLFAPARVSDNSLMTCPRSPIRPVYHEPSWKLWWWNCWARWRI